MNLTSYLAEAERRYHFRIKTVVPIGDAEMDRIEIAVAKYQPIEIKRPKKTILQKQPLDFKDLQNFEVYIVDMTLALPASPYVLQQDIRQSLNVPEKYIVVRGDNEPVEVENQRLAALNDIADEAAKRGLKPASLLADSNYEEFDEPQGDRFYGDKHNSALLAYIEKVRAEREPPPNPEKQLFNWLDMPDRKDQQPVQDDTDFNAHLNDKRPKASANAKSPSESVQGNIDDDTRSVTRLYRDKDGNRVKLSRKQNSVRGEKA